MIIQLGRYRGHCIDFSNSVFIFLTLHVMIPFKLVIVGMSGEEKEKNKILHVANISTAATRDHVYNMFNYLGKIQEMRVSLFFDVLLKTYGKPLFFRSIHLKVI